MTVEEMRDFKAEIVRDADAASGLQFFQFSGGQSFVHVSRSLPGNNTNRLSSLHVQPPQQNILHLDGPISGSQNRMFFYRMI